MFDLGQDFVFGIFAADESEVLGGSGLHTRAGEGGLEIGYWVRADRTRRGIATSVAAALTRVGIELAGADRIEILVEAGNEPSATIARRLGFREEGLLRRGSRLQAVAPSAMRWSSRCWRRSSPARPQPASASRPSTAAGCRSPSLGAAAPLDLEKVGDHHVVASDG